MKIGEGSSTEEIEEQELADVMPFGKHKGKLICELSTNYIQFLLTNCDWIDDTLKGKLQKEFDKKRDDMPCYGKLFNYNSRDCMKCPYNESCSEENMGEVTRIGNYDAGDYYK